MTPTQIQALIDAAKTSGTDLVTWVELKAILEALKNQDGVSSFEGRTGGVVGETGDYNTSMVPESGNLYFTNTRARNAISLTTTGIGAATYDPATGVFNIPVNATESDTLHSVTTRNNSTTNSIIVAGATVNGDIEVVGGNIGINSDKKLFLDRGFGGAYLLATGNGGGIRFGAGYNDGMVLTDGRRLLIGYLPGQDDLSNRLQVNGSARISDLSGTGIRMVVANASGLLSTQSIPSLSGYVPYTGATQNVNLGAYNLASAKLTQSATSSFDAFTANGQYQIFSNSSTGLTLSGRGSIYDIQLVNQAGTTVMAVEANKNIVLINQAFDNLSGAKLQVSGAATTTDLIQTNKGGGLVYRAYYGSGNNRPLDINIDGANGDAHLTFNTTYSGGWKYYLSNYSAKISSGDGLLFSVAAMGTANNSISWIDALRINSSGNLGIGVTPSAWASGYKVIDISGGAAIAGLSNGTFITSNAYSDDASWKYKANSFATLNLAINGEHRWYTAPSGTAGAAITFTQAMTLDASGRLGIGTTSPNRLLMIKNSSDGVNGIGFQNYANTTELAYIRYEQTNDILDIVNNSAFGGGGIKFSTNATERIRITSSGRILMGTTTDNLTDLLQVAGSGRFNDIGIGSGTIAEKISIFASTSPNLGISFTPLGWNGAKHRFNVPVSGNESLVSFNWSGSARDYASYGTSYISVGDGKLRFATGSGTPTERFSIGSSGDLTFSNVPTSASASSVANYLSVTVNGTAYLIPLHQPA